MAHDSFSRSTLGDGSPRARVDNWQTSGAGSQEPPPVPYWTGGPPSSAVPVAPAAPEGPSAAERVEAERRASRIRAGLPADDPAVVDPAGILERHERGMVWRGGPLAAVPSEPSTEPGATPPEPTHGHGSIVRTAALLVGAAAEAAVAAARALAQANARRMQRAPATPNPATERRSPSRYGVGQEFELGSPGIPAGEIPVS